MASAVPTFFGGGSGTIRVCPLPSDGCSVAATPVLAPPPAPFFAGTFLFLLLAILAFCAALLLARAFLSPGASPCPWDASSSWLRRFSAPWPSFPLPLFLSARCLLLGCVVSLLSASTPSSIDSRTPSARSSLQCQCKCPRPSRLPRFQEPSRARAPRSSGLLGNPAHALRSVSSRGRRARSA